MFENDAPQAPLRSPGIVSVLRKGRVLTIVASAGLDAVMEEARALNPASIDAMPVSLKEIFLETIREEAQR